MNNKIRLGCYVALMAVILVYMSYVFFLPEISGLWTTFDILWAVFAITGMPGVVVLGCELIDD